MTVRSRREIKLRLLCTPTDPLTERPVDRPRPYISTQLNRRNARRSPSSLRTLLVRLLEEAVALAGVSLFEEEVMSIKKVDHAWQVYPFNAATRKNV